MNSFRQYRYSFLLFILNSISVHANDIRTSIVTYKLKPFEDSLIEKYERDFGLKNNQVVADILFEPIGSSKVTIEHRENEGSYIIKADKLHTFNEATYCDQGIYYKKNRNIQNSFLESILKQIGKKSLVLTVIDGEEVGCKIINATLKL